MKLFFSFVLIVFLKSSWVLSAPNSCQSLGEFLRQPQHLQESIKISLTQLLGFEYVRHVFLNHFQVHDLVCSQVLALSKGQYQYYRYMIELSVHPSDNPQLPVSFYLYFQDASTQAFHNYTGKPWVGLEPQKHQKFMKQLQNHLSSKLDMMMKEKKQGVEQINVEEDIYAAIKKTKVFQENSLMINKNTISLWRLDSKNILVTWMKNLSQSSNPFLNSEVSQGLYLRYEDKEKKFKGFSFLTSFERVENEGKNQNLFESLEENLSQTLKEAQAHDWSQFLFENSVRTL